MLQIKQRPDRGAAAVEFALVLPVLLLLIVGIIDFGRAYNARIALSHAARESVRVWALTQDASETQIRAVASAPTLTGVVATPNGACTFGDPTTVTVTANFAFITPLIGQLAPGTTSLMDQGVMRCGG